MTIKEKIAKTISSIKQVSFGRADEDWLDAFKQGMEVALKAEEFEQDGQICIKCKFNNKCKIQSAWLEIQMDNLECCDDYEKWTSPFGCNKFKEKE